MEGKKSVAETKEHNGWFEEAKWDDENGFSLVRLLDVNVVISPTNVKLGGPGRILHSINGGRDEREGVCIADSMRVEVVIVLAWVKRTMTKKN